MDRLIDRSAHLFQPHRSCPMQLPTVSAYHSAYRYRPSLLPIISANHFCLSHRLSLLPIILPIASAHHFCLSHCPSLLPLASAPRFCTIASACHTAHRFRQRQSVVIKFWKIFRRGIMPKHDLCVKVAVWLVCHEWLDWLVRQSNADLSNDGMLG